MFVMDGSDEKLRSMFIRRLERKIRDLKDRNHLLESNLKVMREEVSAMLYALESERDEAKKMILKLEEEIRSYSKMKGK